MHSEFSVAFLPPDTKNKQSDNNFFILPLLFCFTIVSFFQKMHWCCIRSGAIFFLQCNASVCTSAKNGFNISCQALRGDNEREVVIISNLNRSALLQKEAGLPTHWIYNSPQKAPKPSDFWQTTWTISTEGKIYNFWGWSQYDCAVM